MRFIQIGDKTENHRLLETANIPVTYFPQKNSKRPVWFDVWKYLLKINADAYICHFASGIHVTACLLARKTPLILIAMGQDILQEGAGRITPLRKSFNQISVKKSDYIFSKSKYITKELNNWGINSEKIGLNYWGADLKIFYPGDKNNAKKKLGIPLNKKIILSPRAFAQHYNIHLITEAFVLLTKEVSNVDIIFIGRPSDEKYINEVKKILEKNNCGERAHFAYNVGINDIIDYYHAADISVSMAKTEGFPNTVFELMACNVPILIGRIPHVEDLLKDRENAIFCNINSTDINKKLHWILNPLNSKEITRISSRGQELVQEFGDINRNASNFVSQIKLINRKVRRHFPFEIFFLLLIQIFWKKLNIIMNKVR